MPNRSDDNPLDDLQTFLKSLKDKYGDNMNVQAEFEHEPPLKEEPADDQEWDLDFDYTPREIRRHLDNYVIGQDEAKKHLANAVCYHYHQTRRDDPYYQKKNILMIGNTGVGKTHLVQVLSDFIGVPFVKADATKFSGTGYVGKNVNSLIRELAEKADHDIDRAEHGIVFIDEIDKICSSRETDRDVSGRDVQTNLLKLLEETEVSLMDPSNPLSMMRGMQNLMGSTPEDMEETISTRKILFIMSGVFPGLEKRIADRLNRGGMGFTGGVDSDRDLATLRHCETRDLVDFGLEEEFVGRLPIRTYLHDLESEHLYRILTESDSSVLRQYKRDFSSYGMELSFTEDALREIARKAKSQSIGARGLTSVLEETLFEYMHELPGTDESSLTVDKQTVENPRRMLYQWQMEDELSRVIDQEFGDYDVDIEVTEDGREKLLDLALENEETPERVFLKRFDSLHHILNMIDFDRLEIDASFVENHERELDRLCSDYFKEQETAS